MLLNECQLRLACARQRSGPETAAIQIFAHRFTDQFRTVAMTQIRFLVQSLLHLSRQPDTDSTHETFGSVTQAA